MPPGTIHVGIVPCGGCFSYYNDAEKNKVDLRMKCVGGNEIEKVDLMFEEMKSKINGKLGCVCIFIYEYYGNKIRKKFIEAGLKSGFKNVEFINGPTAFYLNAMSQINYKPLNESVIWIEVYGYFYIWKTNDQKAKFIGCWKADSSKLNELQKIVDKSKLDKGPNVVLYHENKPIEAIFKEISDCQFFSYTFNGNACYANGSLTRARITAGDMDLIHLDTEDFLTQNITIKINDQEITIFQFGQQLPIIYSQKLIKQSTDHVLTIIRGNCTEDITLPDEKNIKLNFKVDTNGIYFFNFGQIKNIICINQNNVAIYEDLTENLTSFPSSVDYGFGCPKVGVFYNSPTVINGIIKHFGGMPKQNSIPVREIYYPSKVKRFYVFKFGQNERLIEEEKVIVDLIEEGIKRSQISKKNIILTIPIHLSEIQKEAYLKAAKSAGLLEIDTVDEQIALAFGYEKQNAIAPDTEYLMVNICDTVIKITLNKVGDNNKKNRLQKTIDCENLNLSKLAFFDEIINSENKTERDTHDFELSFQNLFDAINELIENATNLTSMVVTENQMFIYGVLRDNYSNFNITFIENCEELIVKGAALA